jgi:hypothetical protein
MLKALLLAATTLVSTAVISASADASDPVSIAGYPLGRPFTMPQCPGNRVALEAKAPCWTEVFPNEEQKDVRWPESSDPLGYSTSAHVRNGVLVGMSFSTAGVNDQESTLRKLREKFGEPSSLKQDPVQNGFGAKAVKYEAVWEAPNVHVEFYGVRDRLDHGVVEIETPAEHARWLRTFQQQRKL